MDTCSRLWTLLLCALVLGWPVGDAAAAELQFQSDTLLRSFSRDTSAGTEQQVIPAYEYLRLSLRDLGAEGVSLHLYGWGRSDFADNGFFKHQNDGELLYGYLEYAHPRSNFWTRLGRHYVYAGVTREAVDGLSLHTDLGRYFDATLYGGQPVGYGERHGRTGDSIYGGRLGQHAGNLYDLGVSYKLSENDNVTVAEQLGADLSLYLPHGIGFYGSSVLNLETDDWAEHAYELRFNAGGVQLRPHLEMYRYADLFGTDVNTVNPFRVLAQGADELLVYGVDASWRRTAAWEYGAKLRHHDSDQRDAANYLALLTTWHGEALTQVGGEVGYLAGDLNHNDMLLLRLFGYWDQLPKALPIGFVSADLLIARYDQAVFGEDQSLFASLGVGRRFLAERLILKLSGDYSQDPYFDDDLRGLATLTFVYDSSL